MNIWSSANAATEHTDVHDAQVGDAPEVLPSRIVVHVRGGVRIEGLEVASLAELLWRPASSGRRDRSRCTRSRRSHPRSPALNLRGVGGTRRSLIHRSPLHLASRACGCVPSPRRTGTASAPPTASSGSMARSTPHQRGGGLPGPGSALRLVTAVALRDCDLDRPPLPGRASAEVEGRRRREGDVIQPRSFTRRSIYTEHGT
jgi:hypothetical protein